MTTNRAVPVDPNEQFEHYTIMTLPLAITTTRARFSTDFREGLKAILLQYLDEVSTTEFVLDETGNVSASLKAPVQKTNLKTKH